MSSKLLSCMYYKGVEYKEMGYKHLECYFLLDSSLLCKISSTVKVYIRPN